MSLGFLSFLDRWTRLQGQRTPTLHADMAQWLQARLVARDPLWLLLAFRGSGKSTLVGLFAAWLLARAPATRILVLSADQALAAKMVRTVKRIVEQHPDCAGLKPARADQWAADRFTICRDVELRDPSMLARGVTGNVTGSHADVIICDDVEVPNTCDTADKRAALRARLAELDHVLVPGGFTLYIGTPHSWWSIYAETARPDCGETRPFLADAVRLRRPVIDPAGRSAWPELFPPETIARIRARSGPNRFASQMMLEPVDIADGHFEPERLGRYHAEPDYREAHGRAALRLMDRPLVGGAAWWDPAFGRTDADGRTTGDGSVLACVYGDAEGRRYLHRVAWLTAPHGEEPAHAQCRAVAALVGSLHLPAVWVETNGIGRFLPGLLRHALADAGVAASVREASQRRPKTLRILEAWDAPLAAGALLAHETVWRGRLIEELRGWRPDRPGTGHDDGLDAVAGALSVEPDRLGAAPRAIPRPDWRPGARVHTATVERDG